MERGGGGGRGDEMMMTSGATGRIHSVFRSVLSRRALLRVAVALQSLFLWLLLLVGGLRRRRAAESEASAAAEAGAGTWKARRRRQAAEEEDVRRRRALAEEVAMAEGAGAGQGTRWDTFLVAGARRNALFCRLWAPATKEMRGILVIIHGLNEHSGRYLHFAEQLTACGFGVYAMDWIGHGGSDGLHGYVPSLDYVVEDIEVLLDKIMMENPGVPCFLLGHSTGGAVVLKASLYSHIREKLEGIILTSPALRVKPAHPIVGAVAPIFSLVAPKFQFKGANKRGIPVSRDPAALLAKYSDPLVYTGPIRVRTGHEILRISSYLLHNLKKVTIPFMVLHGTADRVTDPLASQDLYNEAASRHKDLRLYDGFLHDLLFEPERDEIGAEIIGWMDGMLRPQAV
ncbi:Monoglyceride lipase [Dichanthelium oligosanthes]|uniref:Monoglyceride lipase n=1 Tax=Dichanthelium oligosanthes TaxID=888268 RepID=A0A1E5VNB0_9POAL|nr:Monoglyceride lipase [Dichanthelium oligosanthes]